MSTEPSQGARSGPARWITIFIGALRRLWDSLLREVNAFMDAPLSWLVRALRGLALGILRLLRLIVLLPVLLVASLVRWLASLTLRRIWAFAWRAAVLVVVLLGAGFFLSVHWPHSQVPEIAPPDQIVYQDQGWGAGREAPDRQTYYFTPQGAGNVLRNMRYDWFVNLELPWGRQRLADPGQMRAYGFQVDTAPTAANPHLLPVGFTRHYDERLGEEVLDVSCAACHTGSLLVRRDDGSTVSLRIDGGQAMHAFTAANMPHFVPVLLASMVSTYVNPFKFNRFALKVLGPYDHETGRKALRVEFKKTLDALLAMGKNEKLHGLAPLAEGYARTDALTRIANAVFGDHITPANYKPGWAPVSYPPVWDIWKFDWVQYSASVAQPMARNLGESLGVGASYDFTDVYGRPLPEDRRYDTSTRLEDLHEIELALRRLRPPVWPEDILGDVDREKAVRGGIAFIRTCQGCHGPHPADPRQKTLEMPGKTDRDPHWRVKTLTAQEIGTDPNAAVNFVELTFDLTPTGLTNEEVREVVGDEIRQRIERMLDYDYPEGVDEALCGPLSGYERDQAPTLDRAACREELENQMTRELDAINIAATTNGQGLNYFGLLMKRKLYRDGGYSEEEIRELNGFDALDLPQVMMVYKARPLAGAWATAPYLHNGSVRDLYQLLGPQHERDERFFIGRPEFDPRQVGLARADGKEGGFWFDTTFSGNANTGHEFRAGYTSWKPGSPPQYGVIGAAYTPEERYEIIEYVKTHLDDPPHSPLFSEIFAGVVARAQELMPEPAADEDEIGRDAEAREIARRWPEGQACNLREYLKNHEQDAGIDGGTTAAIDQLLKQLERYFARPDSYVCGGETRFQRGG